MRKLRLREICKFAQSHIAKKSELGFKPRYLKHHCFGKVLSFTWIENYCPTHGVHSLATSIITFLLSHLKFHCPAPAPFSLSFYLFFFSTWPKGKFPICKSPCLGDIKMECCALLQLVLTAEADNKFCVT